MRYEQTKGKRIFRYGWGVQTSDPNWYWHLDEKRWVNRLSDDFPDGDLSNTAPCRTLRAYRRMLRKNPFLKGNSVFINKYCKHNIYG